MNIFGSPVVPHASDNVCFHQCFFHSWAAKPSPGLTFWCFSIAMWVRNCNSTTLLEWVGSCVFHPKSTFSMGVYESISGYMGAYDAEGINSPAAAGAPAGAPGAPHIPIYTSIYHHMHSYTFIYLHVQPYDPIYLHMPHIFLYIPMYPHIPPYTPIYFQISNIRNMRANMRAKNGHIAGPRPFPKKRI